MTSGYNGTEGCPIQPSFRVPVSPEVRRQANQIIAALREQNQYEGSDPFAWFDLGAPEPITANRGPYSVDVAYELAPRPSRCESTLHAYYCYQCSIVGLTE